MNADYQRWRSCAWLRSLVFQWHKARSNVATSFQRPFSRDWEELLRASDLLSAESREESFREARELQTAGLVELKTQRYRSYQIERIVIPFAAEPRVKYLFADELPDASGAKFDFASVNWASPLTFVARETVTVGSAELLKLNEFLLKQPRSQQVVPIKERSLEVFGDEKRLDALVDSALFREGRLTLALLGCEMVAEPLAWKRGPAAAATRPVIVLENAATWHSYARWNAMTAQFSAVIYGGGNRFVDGVSFLAEIFRELGGPRRVFYFGDLDSAGLRIARRASERAQRLGLSPIEPHVWSYRELLKFHAVAMIAEEDDVVSEADLTWIGDLAESVRPLLASGRRLAQEHIGWEYLCRVL